MSDMLQPDGATPHPDHTTIYTCCSLVPHPIAPHGPFTSYSLLQPGATPCSPTRSLHLLQCELHLRGSRAMNDRLLLQLHVSSSKPAHAAQRGDGGKMAPAVAVVVAPAVVPAVAPGAAPRARPLQLPSGTVLQSSHPLPLCPLSPLPVPPLPCPALPPMLFKSAPLIAPCTPAPPALASSVACHMYPAERSACCTQSVHSRGRSMWWSWSMLQCISAQQHAGSREGEVEMMWRYLRGWEGARRERGVRGGMRGGQGAGRVAAEEGVLTYVWHFSATPAACQ